MRRSQDWFTQVCARYLEGDLRPPAAILGDVTPRKHHERWTLSILGELHQDLKAARVHNVRARVRQDAHTLHLDPPGGW